MGDQVSLLVLFGGRSAEHQISLLSAKSVIEAVDRERFAVVLVGIDSDGVWRLYPSESEYLVNADDPERIELAPGGIPVTLCKQSGRGAYLLAVSPDLEQHPVDVVFPVMHGTFAEDGTLQGLLEMMDLPYVGCGVLTSSVAMDKDYTKRLLLKAGLPVANGFVFESTSEASAAVDQIQAELGFPVFVKPANLGSSVGISKVESVKEYQHALEQAFRYDSKVLVEECIVGREIECAVLGNDEPEASALGEITPSERHGFYSYDAKYIDSEGAALHAPAQLPEETAERVKQVAVEVYKALGATGLSRVDVFVTESGEVVVNEINTMPGFTRISMYPKLWEISGLSYTELVTRLIELGIERCQRRRNLTTQR